MKRFILSLVTVFFMGVLLGNGANMYMEREVISLEMSGLLSVGVGLVSGVVMSLAKFQKTNMAFGNLQTEVWIADIEENLFMGSEFAYHSIDDSVHVNNKTVNLPQAGAKPTIVKNRAVFPATIAERTDAILTYNIDNYTTDPILVRNFDETQISYAKRQSVLAEHQAILSERFGTELAYIWSPSGTALRVLRTTGDATSDLAPSATGTRKRFTKEDAKSLAKQMDIDKTPKDGRYLLLTPTMYYELFDIDALLRWDYTGKQNALPKGVINEIFGFDVMVRAEVTMYNSAAAGVIKAVGAAPAATDCYGGLAWSKYRVRRAVSGTQVYYSPDRPEYFGGIMSAEINFGGSKARTNSEGIVAIAQGVGA